MKMYIERCINIMNQAIAILLVFILANNILIAQEAKQNDGRAINPDDFSVVRYGDWELVCEKRNSQACVMAQIGLDTRGTPVVEMRVRKLKTPQIVEGKEIVAIADILTPLAVMLIPGVELQIDLGAVYAAPYQLCTETGCLVREPIAKETVSAFKQGSKASISMIAAVQQKEVRATISLKGFTHGYNNLK